MSHGIRGANANPKSLSVDLILHSKYLVGPWYQNNCTMPHSQKMKPSKLENFGQYPHTLQQQLKVRAYNVKLSHVKIHQSFVNELLLNTYSRLDSGFEGVR